MGSGQEIQVRLLGLRGAMLQSGVLFLEIYSIRRKTPTMTTNRKEIIQKYMLLQMCLRSSVGEGYFGFFACLLCFVLHELYRSCLLSL